MKRTILLSIASICLVSLIAVIALPKTPGPIDRLDDLTVHEWGTFTSVAGPTGQAIAWRTYSSPGDLPCFVERFGGSKGGLFGTVRMETPVLYFYGSRDVHARVKVLFPKGTLTEWYPKAALKNTYDAIEWSDIRVLPKAPADFPTIGQSHYYAARQTDAVPVQVGNQTEKFLFYRGVGNFAVPISVLVEEDGRIQVRNTGADAISGVILFENRKGKIRYQIPGNLTGEISLDNESSHSDMEALFADLESILVTQGLYPKEAKAMIATWRDSWFEEGTRVFYIVPSGRIDKVLPLEIQPSPAQISRVFVGRMEIMTPAIEQDVREAVAANDRVALQKYGRFLGPIAQRIGLKSALLDQVYSDSLNQITDCRR